MKSDSDDLFVYEVPPLMKKIWAVEVKLLHSLNKFSKNERKNN